MDDTLGLLEEATHLARELGYQVREEPLGELPGGPCVIGSQRSILLNLEGSAVQRLTVLLGVLTGDPRTAAQPKSRLLATRLQALQGG